MSCIIIFKRNWYAQNPSFYARLLTSPWLVTWSQQNYGLFCTTNKQTTTKNWSVIVSVLLNKMHIFLYICFTSHSWVSFGISFGTPSALERLESGKFAWITSRSSSPLSQRSWWTHWSVPKVTSWGSLGIFLVSLLATNLWRFVGHTELVGDSRGRPRTCVKWTGKFCLGEIWLKYPAYPAATRVSTDPLQIK